MKNTAGMSLSQVRALSEVSLCNMFLRVPLNLSTIPFDCAWYGVDNLLSVPIISVTSDIAFETRC